MKVKLLSSTPNALDVVYKAMKTCYSEVSPIDIPLPNDIEKLKLVNKVIASGHLSPVEHVNFTFGIENITRACSHQLVRHRHCSFSQQSQRYVKFENLKGVCPDSIIDNEQAFGIYIETLNKIGEGYKKLLELGIKPEDARSVLPNCTTTNITMTLNLRELMHICNERLCSRAQKEIRELVGKMCAEVITAEYWTEQFLVPKCEKLGYCPEHNGCGRVQGK